MKTNGEHSAPPCGLAITLLAVAALLQGCSSIASTSGTQQALVCPQCKMVETVAWPPPGPSPPFSRAGVSAYSVNPLYPRATITKHICSGCQGALTTFAREGKWEHICSICQQRAFNCPIIHPGESTPRNAQL